MKSVTGLLSSAEYELLNRCIAWHVRPHRQAFVDGLAVIDADLRFDGRKVLELGATGRSTVSPFMVARGAEAMATCYGEDDLPALDTALASYGDRYGLPRAGLAASRADIFALDSDASFDIVILKDVLGGINRHHDIAAFRDAAGNCLSILNQGGHLLIIDKGVSLKITHQMLRRWGSAGRNDWHYFSFDELARLVPQGSFKTAFSAYGILSFADFGGGALQTVADLVDENILEPTFPGKMRTVFSFVISKV